MLRLLIASVLVIAGSVYVARQFFTPSQPTSPAGAENQIDKARQDVNDAMQKEFQREQNLATPETP